MSNRERALADRIAAIPTVDLAKVPTPLDEAPRAAATLGIERLWIKRDDLTGLAFGGNKARKLRYELAPAVAQGADILVAGGGVSQSNHARQCAAAAAQLGMDCVLVLRSGPRGGARQGNVLLDELLGAEMRLLDTESPEETLAEIERVADELRSAGRRPFIVDLAGLSVVAYAECALEIWRQLRKREATATHLFVASDGGTQAGLLVGGAFLEAGWKIVGARPHPTAGDPRDLALEQAALGSDLLDLSVEISRNDVINLQDYISPGYGVVSDAGREAIRLLARTEGVLLDPVYTGKAFAALRDWAATGRLGRQSRVVFVHTGGLPALFAYANELAESAGLESAGEENR
jgi:1-aminocyclopropane-1-carboxylate deaminase/D-cysteine desulfhydrase-like pyridoxal-dependent ACC family enzyme